VLPQRQSARLLIKTERLELAALAVRTFSDVSLAADPKYTLLQLGSHSVKP
jgi:hypothetical protein